MRTLLNVTHFYHPTLMRRSWHRIGTEERILTYAQYRISFIQDKMNVKSSAPFVHENFVILVTVALVAGHISTTSGNPTDVMLVPPDLIQHVLGSLFNSHLLKEGVDCTTHLFAKCLACQTALDMIIVPIMGNNTAELSGTVSEPEQLATAMCVEYNVTTVEQCRRIVEQTLSTLTQNDSDQSRTEICSSLLRDCHCDQVLPSRK